MISIQFGMETSHPAANHFLSLSFSISFYVIYIFWKIPQIQKQQNTFARGYPTGTQKSDWSKDGK